MENPPQSLPDSPVTTAQNVSRTEKSRRVPYELLAYATTAGATVFTMMMNIKRYAYEVMRERHAFDTPDFTHATRVEAERSITQQFIDRAANAQYPANPVEYLKRIDGEGGPRHVWKKAVEEGYQRLGVHNYWDKFRLLSSDKKIKVVGLGITVAGVMMGAFFKLRQDKRIADRLDTIAANDNAVQTR